MVTNLWDEDGMSYSCTSGFVHEDMYKTSKSALRQKGSSRARPNWSTYERRGCSIERKLVPLTTPVRLSSSIQLDILLERHSSVASWYKPDEVGRQEIQHVLVAPVWFCLITPPAPQKERPPYIWGQTS
jgi:hypothetical protein